MAWEHLSITKPHLVYIILGGFTSLFMLCSSVIKERLYIGEATVATLCGIIFGPHAANLINPLGWGNTDLITLEFSRIVLVVQCFAVGVELPKAYMERHWRSVICLLIPVMTFGWLITSLFIWGLMSGWLDWLDSLCIAACVTATDPVLASSVVGKGKFAKRVPKHLRDLLSAESGCNDGMAFPFVYLALYIIRYKNHPNEVAMHWFCYTILYECIFGAFYGVAIGYIARQLIRYSHERDLIDRESFLVFYFVLALFCAGSGSLLGMDDLLVGFACGVGFSNDGWFLEKTEESHVSNVIDLLINLTFFVYFGTIIPWEQYNAPEIIGLSPWRLVVIAILVLLFRRIPIMMAMMPAIPDIKTWREALFAGHFGPIGVGAIFIAILARAELETESTTPLAVLPEKGFPHLNIIELIWPITTFLVICSIVVHGSSIAVFTLGKHINTLTLTLSYTQANEEGPSWMDRLPRIQSRSKSSMSLRRPDETDSSYDEKVETGSDNHLGLPRNFLRRKDDDSQSRSSSLRPSRRRRWEGMGPGGPISQSAIAPVRRERSPADTPAQGREDSENTALNSDESPEGDRIQSPQEEVYQEGDQIIIEDEEGNVLDVHDSHKETANEKREHNVEDGRRAMTEKDIEDGVAQTEHKHDHHDSMQKIENKIEHEIEHPGSGWREMRKLLQRRHTEPHGEGAAGAKPKTKRGPALAYQFGNTIIVEDEDGEVIKKYDIPGDKRRPDEGKEGEGIKAKGRLHRMGTYLGMSHEETEAASRGDVAAAADKEGQQKGKGRSEREERRRQRQREEESDDEHIRFTVTAGGQRMSKAQFISQIQHMDPKSRKRFVDNSDASDLVKKEVHEDVKDHAAARGSQPVQRKDGESARGRQPEAAQVAPAIRRTGPDGLALVDSDEEEIPFHNFRESLASSRDNNTGAAQRRRRAAGPARTATTPAVPAAAASTAAPLTKQSSTESGGSAKRRQVIGRTETGDKVKAKPTHLDEGETAAERRRREGALGLGSGSSSSEDESDTDEVADVGKGIRRPRTEVQRKVERGRAVEERKIREEDEDEEKRKEEEEEEAKQEEAKTRTPGIRFAEPTRPPQQQQQQQQGQGSSTKLTVPGQGSDGAVESDVGEASGAEEGGNGKRRSGHGHKRSGSFKWGFKNKSGRE
ncbi:Sodium/hydrogen exchanger family-domain-containing protein [Phyllosticta citriasiana]|uniref:Sodium/hydrogen exchanger family-domain-containing protein n=1 Tax=Phyllosticta citriasiana TaxID=595635 RepID=A0ABR1KJR0_9PEZI